MAGAEDGRRLDREFRRLVGRARRGRITEAPAAVRADAMRALDRIETLVKVLLLLEGPDDSLDETAKMESILDGVRSRSQGGIGGIRQR
jgi:hypothetical protein